VLFSRSHVADKALGVLFCPLAAALHGTLDGSVAGRRVHPVVCLFVDPALASRFHLLHLLLLCDGALPPGLHGRNGALDEALALLFSLLSIMLPPLLTGHRVATDFAPFPCACCVLHHVVDTVVEARSLRLLLLTLLNSGLVPGCTSLLHAGHVRGLLGLVLLFHGTLLVVPSFTFAFSGGGISFSLLLSAVCLTLE